MICFVRPHKQIISIHRPRLRSGMSHMESRALFARAPAPLPIATSEQNSKAHGHGLNRFEIDGAVLRVDVLDASFDEGR
jgi:hypothetical protein